MNNENDSAVFKFLLQECGTIELAELSEDFSGYEKRDEWEPVGTLKNWLLEKQKEYEKNSEFGRKK